MESSFKLKTSWLDHLVIKVPLNSTLHKWDPLEPMFLESLPSSEANLHCHLPRTRERALSLLGSLYQCSYHVQAYIYIYTSPRLQHWKFCLQIPSSICWLFFLPSNLDTIFAHNKNATKQKQTNWQHTIFPSSGPSLCHSVRYIKQHIVGHEKRVKHKCGICHLK